MAIPIISSPKESEDRPTLLNLQLHVPAISLESMSFIGASKESFGIRAR
jgi:hypothetical protein